MTERLDTNERTFLRDLAWAAVRAAVTGAEPPDPAAFAAAAGRELGPRLSAPGGAFVTLTSAGQLRGCIGVIEGRRPLAATVVENGRAAALTDPRFPPVEESELSGLELEVSALSPLAAVVGPEEIEVGRHGVLLSAGGRRSVFLPQVAPEQGWDRDTMLTHLALKAGLGPDDWRRDAHFQVFTAEVF
ncbi:MAG: AmmeMemoRadiSam system protein A [bacterium]|nr:AmmeMemoRadiSam system protein A [bacterium]